MIEVDSQRKCESTFFVGKGEVDEGTITYLSSGRI